MRACVCVGVRCVKPGVHTNDFVPIYGRRAKNLGHASITTVFRPSRLTFQPILQENLESPLLKVTWREYDTFTVPKISQ